MWSIKGEKWTTALIVAKSYPLQLPVIMRRCGSLINIKPSASSFLHQKTPSYRRKVLPSLQHGAKLSIYKVIFNEWIFWQDLEKQWYLLNKAIASQVMHSKRVVLNTAFQWYKWFSAAINTRRVINVYNCPLIKKSPCSMWWRPNPSKGSSSKVSTGLTASLNLARMAFTTLIIGSLLGGDRPNLNAQAQR